MNCQCILALKKVEFKTNTGQLQGVIGKEWVLTYGRKTSGFMALKILNPQIPLDLLNLHKSPTSIKRLDCPILLEDNAETSPLQDTMCLSQNLPHLLSWCQGLSHYIT